MKLNDIKKAVANKLGIDNLNPMQRAAAATHSHKLIILAPTGSGKTVAFALTFLQAVGKPEGLVQAVVLAPSRELVLQIGEVVRPIAEGLKTVTLYGGHSVADETNSLKPVPDIVITTPGRLLDHINRGRIDLTCVKALVIDEYDKSLEMGFADEMQRIVRRIASPRCVVLTSATPLTDKPDYIDLDDAEALDFTDKSAERKVAVDIARVESPAKDKADTLIDLLSVIGRRGKTLVFVNHRESADRLYGILRNAGFRAGIYHGGLDQNDRRKALILFSNGSMPILVTTDLASRGLDITDVTSVVHYHMPPSMQSWTHRNGRTARAGASGSVYVITSEADNIPEYVNWHHDYTPHPTDEEKSNDKSFATLHINLGKKEKISRGDIVGFLCRNGGISGNDIGRIDIDDHQSFAAVTTSKIKDVIAAVAQCKLKGQRARISEVLF